MEIRVLGELTIDGARLSPKERSLLAALVLRTGNVVTPSELADAVWGDDVPSTWPKQVQAAIGHIRRALGSASIVTTRAGYRLHVDPDAIDVFRYEQLIDAATTHLANGDPVRAIDLFERASSLWSGEPYSELGDWPPAQVEAERLGEIRMTADEDVQAARMASGEHRAVVPDAERLVRAEPLRERRWAILATALYRNGRQADALAILRNARDRLDDELGIEPGAELVALESAILRQEISLDAPPPPPHTSSECPYRGLQPFSTDDADEFFGRDDDIRAAIARLARSPFLAVSGPSGCGKSSLVLAGLVPTLRARGQDVVVLSSGAAPTSALQEALSARTAADVVVIDQFEEIFHLGLAEAQVADFCAIIGAALASGRSIVLVVRSDFLDECTREPSIGPLFAEGVHLVGPLTPAGLRRAIEEPAKQAGLRLEAGLAELILRDAAGEPGALPHVSHALVETWLRREGATLTVASYEDSGGISGAIAQSADRLYRSMDAAQRELCRSTMLRLVIIGTDGVPMRRRIAMKSMRDDAARELVISRLAGARLISAEQSTLVISHESLATAWPRLRNWLEADADGTRTMNSLALAAEEWDADGRPDDELYGGARLQSALEWRDGSAPELTTLETAFLDGSAARARAAADELVQRADHDRRQNRRLRVLLVAAVALFAVAATGGGLVAVGASETARERTTAQIEALVARSLALRSTERDVAALLAAEAFRRWPEDPRTRSALMGVMTRSHGLLGTTYLDDVGEMTGVLIPGTRHAVVATAQKDVAVFDIDSGARVRSLELPKEQVSIDSRYGPAVSGDGRRVALAEASFDESFALDGVKLAVADIASGEMVTAPIELDWPLSSITMNHDGELIAAIDQGGVVRLIDAESGLTRIVAGTVAHDPQQEPARGGVLRFTPGGRLLYGTLEGPLLLIDPDAAAVVGTVSMPAESANVAMAVLDDTRIVTTGDRRISSVDLATGRVEWSQEFSTDLNEPCSWVAASVALDTVYCGDLWGQIAERSLTTGAPTDRRFDPQLGYVGAMSTAENGRELVVVGRGNPAITRWRLDGSGAVTRLLAPGWSTTDRYSPTGSSIVVARRTEGMQSWEDYREFAVLDTRSGEMTLRLPKPAYGIRWAGHDMLLGDVGGVGPEYARHVDARTGTTFAADLTWDTNGVWMSADGRRLYFSYEDGDIWTVDPATGQRIEPTLHTQEGGAPGNISTSPDGTRVLVTTWSSAIFSTLFDGDTGERLKTGLEGSAWTALTARGEIIAATNNRIVRYDADTFERIGSLPGISGGIDTVSVSPDGRTLSVYAMNETVSVYDLVAGIRLGDPIAVSSEWASSGVFSADGGEMAVNVPAGIAVWDLKTSSQAEAACRMAGRDLSRDEWNAYLGDLGPYRSTCGFGGD